MTACYLGRERMDQLQLLMRLSVALAIGLLVGLERGWQLREVEVQRAPSPDMSPPTVTITAPASGATVPFDGFLLQGTATDAESGVAQVRIYIYDYGRSGYTVSNASATCLVAGVMSFKIARRFLAIGCVAIALDIVVILLLKRKTRVG